MCVLLFYMLFCVLFFVCCCLLLTNRYHSNLLLREHFILLDGNGSLQVFFCFSLYFSSVSLSRVLMFHYVLCCLLPLGNPESSTSVGPAEIEKMQWGS